MAATNSVKTERETDKVSINSSDDSEQEENGNNSDKNDIPDIPDIKINETKNTNKNTAVFQLGKKIEESFFIYFYSYIQYSFICFFALESYTIWQLGFYGLKSYGNFMN